MCRMCVSMCLFMYIVKMSIDVDSMHSCVRTILCLCVQNYVLCLCVYSCLFVDMSVCLMD